jgi:hypothetical protein
MESALFPESLDGSGDSDSGDGVVVVQRSTLRVVGGWVMLGVVTAVLIGALVFATWVVAQVVKKAVEHVDDGPSAAAVA